MQYSLYIYLHLSSLLRASKLRVVGFLYTFSLKERKQLIILLYKNSIDLLKIQNRKDETLGT